MVRVNGKKFTTYGLDTPSSLTTRIAGKFKTLPKYLYFPEGVPRDLSDMDNIVVEDLLKTIREHASRSIDFDDLLQQIKSKLPDKMNVRKDVLYPWLAMNTHVEKLVKDSGNALFLDQMRDKLIEEKYFTGDLDFRNFWTKERAKIANDLDSSIRFAKETSKSQKMMYAEFDDIQNESWIPTEFQTQLVRLIINLDIPDMSLMELFNSLVLNKAVPLATINQYYKILKDYIPNEEWAFTEEDVLSMKVCEKEIVDPAEFKQYTDVKLVMDKDENISAHVDLNIIKNNIKRDPFIKRTLQVFETQAPIAIRDINERQVSGVFYYPMAMIDSYVFADLVMNDPVFSYLIGIDESTKATKKKSDSNQPWLYIHFNHPSTGHVTASITQKITQHGDPVLKQYDAQIFPVGQSYVRVKITKARDINAVKKFIDVFSKLLVLYDEKYNSIVETYLQYIPGFGEVEEEEIEELDMTKPENIAPEVFVSNYTRSCKKEHFPTIIEDDQVGEYEERGLQVMKYPRDMPASGKEFDSDGQDQHYYVCLDPKFKYPGLQENKGMDNAETHPFVPCCFATNQMKKPNYRYYYKGEDIAEKTEKKQQDFIRTNKILGPDVVGKLPPNIEHLFSILDPDPKYEYIRLGVHRNMSSFLSVVMVGMHEKTNILELSAKEHRGVIERVEAINNTRRILASPNWAPACRQSAYDSDINSVRAAINNIESYFDPLIYTQMLETYFDCNIFVFNRDRLLIPRHQQGYYKNKKKRPSIFVYEHIGSKSDHAKYPQCELIFRWNTSSAKDSQYSFPYDQIISKGVNRLFRLVKMANSLYKPIKETRFDLRDIEIVSQNIDSYGKCRQLNLRYDGYDMTVLTSPMAPLAVSEMDQEIVHQIPIQIALKAIAHVGGKIIRQHEQKGVVKELIATVGNVLVAIPVQDSEIIPDIPVDNQVSYPVSQGSLFHLYNYNKKMARYLVEYTYWLFSRFMEKKNVEVITDELLSDFARSQIVVDPDFEYGPVRKKFSRKSGLMKGKKLVVKSEEMLKRLMYVLRLFSLRSTRALVDYRNKRVIQYYYKDITDFDHNPIQVILHGEDSIEKWIQENRVAYVINDSVTIGSRSPYFFKNKKISDDIYLAQNTTSLKQALDIGLTWIREGYNKSVYAKEINTSNYTIYNYVSPRNIKRLSGNGKTPIRILAYKVSDTPFYTALLSLQN